MKSASLLVGFLLILILLHSHSTSYYAATASRGSVTPVKFPISENLPLSQFHFIVTAKGQFIRQPQDIYAFPQSLPPFFCVSNISNATPEWIIDDEYVNRHNINESKYTIDGDGIIVSDLEEADNGSTFQCFVENMESSTGRLMIVQGSAQQLVNISADGFHLCLELHNDERFPVEAIDIDIFYTKSTASYVLYHDSCLNLANKVITEPPSTCENLRVKLNLQFSTELLVNSWTANFLVNTKGLCGDNCCQKASDPTSTTSDPGDKALAAKISVPIAVIFPLIVIVIIVAVLLIKKKFQGGQAHHERSTHQEMQTRKHDRSRYGSSGNN